MTLASIGRMVGLAMVVVLIACSGGEQETTQDKPPVTQDGTQCAAHGAPADLCFICDASLRDSDRLWCREHDRYEDRCWLCHPELQDQERLYCSEHGLYEDECFICHPELQESKKIEPTGSIIESEQLFCNEHGVPELECGICQPTLADNLLPGQGLKIRFLSEEAATKAGVTAQRPEEGDTQPSIAAVGEVTYDQNRLARVTPPSSGIIRRIYADLGDNVSNGQVLANISAPAIAEAKAALITADAEERLADEIWAREEDLFQKEVSSEQRLNEARARYESMGAALRAAEQALLNLGLDRTEVERVLEEKDSDSTLRLRAPFDGTVIARDAVLGDVVDVGDHLFSVADINGMWVRLAVPEASLVALQVGQLAEVSSRTLAGSFPGRVTWISSQLSETTRMADVRVEVSNPDRLLRAGMFVDARVFFEQKASSIVVQRDAVHYFGGKPFVFVKIDDDLYELRRVEVGSRDNGHIPIFQGLASEDLIVTAQSYLVKSEFQKSRLGAGCVD